ncbi:hypothetical protein Rsub_03665 [Raphidocelis subcapitata]|uniref:Sulfotransferase n=1 Tax=Raphidocelis subcapitata TaxID=307507 RepID=A0A2V0P2N6_9CHLO|nr:hypothetical protein Rsub_03665 [Raphidocelis subcapitata]|eukprot:GBF91345.1 hypothetical protein Rsub_03665 [Raphidocelis subcapitata]
MLTPRRAAPPTGLRFLHIPKTGTSFIITLRNQLDACKHKDISCMGAAGGGLWHFEHSKKEKVYSSMFFEKGPPGFDPLCGGNLVACKWGTYHKFYERDFQANNPSFAYVTLIREPVSQTISMAGWKCPSLAEAGDAGWRECLDSAWLDKKYPGNFSTWHDAQTKSLAGINFNRLTKLNEVNLTTALNNLLKLDFFGVTDRWTESICLFHATFGGEPRPSQFLNVRPGHSPSAPAWVVERVRANTVWDRRLYAAGAAAFQCRVDAVLASDRAASYTACVQKHSAKDAGTPGELGRTG